MFQFLLDNIFPRKALVRELERMDAFSFAARVKGAMLYVGKETISCFEYQNPLVRQAIIELKYRGNKKVARLLATALYDELMGFLEEYAPLTNFSEPLLMPIPLSKKRESERGFNQCRLLADALLNIDGGKNFTLSFALTKCKDTESQTKVNSRTERLSNLTSCFTAEQSVVGRRNIILIDDVTTTGATFLEARRTLLRAGARKVIAFAVAH